MIETFLWLIDQAQIAAWQLVFEWCRCPGGALEIWYWCFVNATQVFECTLAPWECN